MSNAGGLAAQQVVVHPVVPDQVARAQPGEHLGEVPPVEVALTPGHRLRRRGQVAVDQRPGHAGVGVVQHRHTQPERGQPVAFTGGGQDSGGQRRQDPARAEAEQRRLVGAADPVRRVERLRDRLHVGVETPVGVPGVRVAPGDHEHLLPLLDEVLDQAAARGEIERVVLVDRRRDDQQRHLCTRSVCGRYWISSSCSVRSTTAPGVAAMLRPIWNDDPSTICGTRGAAGQVAGQVQAAAHEVQAAGVDRRLRRRRVQPAARCSATAPRPGSRPGTGPAARPACPGRRR